MSNSLISKAAFSRRAGVDPSRVTRLVADGGRLAAALVGKRIDFDHPEARAYMAERNEGRSAITESGTDIDYDKAVAACRQKGSWSTGTIRASIGCGSGRAKKIQDVMKATGVYGSVATSKAPPVTVPMPAKKRGSRRRSPAKAPSDGPIEIPPRIVEFLEWTLREVIEKFGTDDAFVNFLKATKVIEDIEKSRIANAEKAGTLVSRKLVKVGFIDAVNSTHRRILSDGVKRIAAEVFEMCEAGQDVREAEAFVMSQIQSYIRPMKDKIAQRMKGLELRDAED